MKHELGERSFYATREMANRLCRLTADNERLRTAICAWWRHHRPIRWDEAKHVASPHVNLQWPVERALADLAALAPTPEKTEETT